MVSFLYVLYCKYQQNYLHVQYFVRELNSSVKHSNYFYGVQNVIYEILIYVDNNNWNRKSLHR